MKKTNLSMIDKTKAVIFILVLALSACTKQREASFPDGVGDDIFEKASFDGRAFSVKTADSVSLRSESERFRGGDEMDRVKVVSAETPESFQPMFKDLQIFASGDRSVKMRFKINKLFLTTYKVVDDGAQIPAVEHDLAEDSEVAGEKLIPIFQYKVKAYGVVVRTRNALGEETKDLKLKPAAWAQATHIQISTLVSDRISVTANSKDNDEIFVRESLDNRLISRDNLRSKVGVKVDLPASSALVYTRMDNDTLKVYEISSFASLPAEQRKLIRTGVDAPHSEVIRCSAASFVVQDQSARESLPAGDDCVLVVRYSFSAPAVEARRSVDVDGIASNEVKYEEIDARNARLVKIVANSNASHVILAGEGLRPVSDDSISVHSVKDKEFFLRRTLQDSPNSFDETFTGESGSLEIVKFVFERNLVRVVRSRPLLDVSGTNSTDLDTLIAVPAVYYKILTTDARGNPFAIPRYVYANSDEDGAFAEVKWAENTIANVGSALSYYSLEQCFDGSRVNGVSSIDQRLETDGVLNFSIDRVYQASRGEDCAGIYRHDGFDAVQSTFAFRERFSFKRYDAADETPLFTVPFQAQKKIGMGLFTYKKNMPNAYHNAGTVATELPLGAIYDIRAGKKIKYVLAGLSTDADQAALRKRLILGTKKVIGDWNETFRKALKGTALERTDDVIELFIEGNHAEEGLPFASPMQLGDLERNYIYNIQKATSSPVIGLGGSHANPRTGVVQAASVFMYGGNILSYVDTAKKRAKIQVEYAKNAKATLTPIEAEASPVPVPAPANEASSVAPATARASSSTPATPSVPVLALSPSFSARGNRLNSVPIHADHVVDTAHLIALRNFGADVSQLRENPQAADQAIEKTAESLRPADRAFQEAIREAMKQGALSNSRKFEAIYLNAQVAYMGASLPSASLQSLKNTAMRQKAVADLYGRLEAAGTCVFDTSEAGEISAEDLSSLDDNEVVGKIWDETLAHELGHNFGLRHNFIATFDRANFPKDGERAADVKREYSSVMDYMHGAVNFYDGPGAQDVASIRAAYGNQLELDPSVRVVTQAGKRWALDIDGNFVTAVTSNGEKNFVDINQYYKAVGVDSWLNLDSKAMNRLPIKKYLFCTDEDAGESPTCNRFDRGTTPSEIVENHMNDYRSLYAQSNFPNDRLQFTSAGSSSYVSRLFTTMRPMRQFLEETFYQLRHAPPAPENLSQAGLQKFQASNMAVVNSYAEAAGGAMAFFEEVIRTPQAPDFLSASGNTRWKTEEQSVNVKGANGQVTRQKLTMNVERKYLEDVKMDETTDRLSVRGIELDKVVAMIMLTERHFGFSRYEKDSIAIAFPYFNQLVSASGTKLEDLATIHLLKEVMTDHVVPAAVAFLDDGNRPLRSLGATYESPVSQLLRFYAVKGAIINLDLDGLEQRSNFSNLFRILNGKNPPSGTVALAESESDLRNQNTLKYWAYDLGDSAKSIISEVQVADQLTAPTTQPTDRSIPADSRGEAIKKGMGKWFAKKLELDQVVQEAQQPQALLQVASLFRSASQRSRAGMVALEVPEAIPGAIPSAAPSMVPVAFPSAAPSAAPLPMDRLTRVTSELIQIEAEVNGILSQVSSTDQPRVVAERDENGEMTSGMGSLMMSVYAEGQQIAKMRLQLDSSNSGNVEARIEAMSREAHTDAERQALIAALRGINSQGDQIKDLMIDKANRQDLVATQIRNIVKDDNVVEAVLAGIPVPKYTDSTRTGELLTDQQLADNAVFEALGSIIPTGMSKTRRAVEFSSIQMLSDIFSQLHGEFFR